MLKERFENTKRFIKEHKFEIIGGGLAIASAVIGVKLFKDAVDRIETADKNSKASDLWLTAYNNATDITNNIMIPELNSKWDGIDFSNYETDENHKALYDEYNNEYESRFNDLLEQEIAKLS